MDFDDNWVPVILLAIIIGLGAFIIIEAIKEDREWERFKVEHKCKVVAHIDGDVFNTFGVGTNGNPSIGIGATSDKTGWLCNDGVTYFK